MSQKFKLVVFDLDGTLINSGAHILNLLNEMRNHLNMSKLSWDDALPLLSLGGEKIIAGALGVSALHIQSYLDEFRQLYKSRPTPQDCVFPNVKELLDALTSECVKKSICTNKARELTDKVLSELSLDHYFSIICADGDLPTKKPNKANLLYCLNAFGIYPADTLMVGDSKVDQDLALACGVPFAWFTKGNNDGVDRLQTIFTFEDFSELRSWLSF
jgi:phosphoglycolate phosphatase